MAADCVAENKCGAIYNECQQYLIEYLPGNERQHFEQMVRIYLGLSLNHWLELWTVMPNDTERYVGTPQFSRDMRVIWACKTKILSRSRNVSKVGWD